MIVDAQTTKALQQWKGGYNVNALECYCIALQESQRMGQPELSSQAIEKHMNLLVKLKPSTKLPQVEIEPNSIAYMPNDLLLKKYGTADIPTIDTHMDLADFKAQLKLKARDILSCAQYVGYRIRLVYEYGHLIKVTTHNAHIITSEDIKDKLTYLIPFDIMQLEKVPLMEIWATLTFDIGMSYELCKRYHSSYAAITKFLTMGIPTELTSAFHVIADQLHTQNIQFKQHTQKLAFLKNCGFEIPMCLSASKQNYTQIEQTIPRLISHYESRIRQHELSYPIKGILLQCNDIDGVQTLNAPLVTERHCKVLLKISPYWSTCKVKAKVQGIEWLEDAAGQFKPSLIISKEKPIGDAPNSTRVLLQNLNELNDNMLAGNEIVVVYANGQTHIN